MATLFEQALQAHSNGDAKRAEKLCQRLLNENGSDKDALHLLGMLAAAAGDLSEALVRYRASLAADPNQPAVLFNLGNLQRRLTSDSQAIESYRSALTLHAGFVEAAVNLSSVLRERGEHEDAANVLVATSRVVRGNPKLANAQGLLRKDQGDYERAIMHYERALELAPDFADAEHNLAVVLRLDNRPMEAIEHYGRLLDRGINDYQLLHNVANAYSDLGEIEQASAGFMAALEQQPDYVHSHINLSTLRWEQGDAANYLNSFDTAFAAGYQTVPMQRAYLELLLRAERFDEIERFLASLEGVLDDAAHHNYLGRVAGRQSRWDEAVAEHKMAVSLDGASTTAPLTQVTGNPDEALNYSLDLVAAQLATGEWVAARDKLLQILADDSTHPLAVAYLSTVWRLQNDSRRTVLADYTNLVQEYWLPEPDEDGRADYLNGLITTLQALHTSQAAPLEQTLVSGTQTRGNLFGRETRELGVLQAMIKDAVTRYVLAMREHPASQFMRLPEEVNINASWSVSLSSSGYHTSHMHPLGAISGVYYVDIPAEIGAANGGGEAHAAAGCLTLGQPGIDVGVELDAEHSVVPKAGKLVLFPSFLWHGTQPFTSRHNRLTIAFDVAPRPQPNLDPSPLVGDAQVPG